MNLNLREAILYKKIEEFPCQGTEAHRETLLCHELNPAQSRSIEPQKELLLGKLLFTGQKAEDDEKGQIVTLPEGLYLFEQCRHEAVLNQDEWLDMAIEQQKDGLWERNKPGNLLYTRFLYEDGSFVTQVFRPLI